jgi:hypothetical protein
MSYSLRILEPAFNGLCFAGLLASRGEDVYFSRKEWADFQALHSARGIMQRIYFAIAVTPVGGCGRTAAEEENE